MNRFAHAALTDEEIAQLTDRFAQAAKLLKVDKIEVEHKQTSTMSLVFESRLIVRIGTRWLGTWLDWMVLEEARVGNFAPLSKIALALAKMLHDGHGEVPTESRFTAIAKELDSDG